GRRDRGREPVVDEHLGGAVGRDLEREGGGPIHLLEARERDAVGDVADTPAVDVSLQRVLPPGAARVARQAEVVDELERRRQRRAARQDLPVEKEVLVAILEE